MFCLPKIRSIEVADYDDDNTDEYIFTYEKYDSDGGSDIIYISYVDVNSSFTPIEEQAITITIAQFDDGTTCKTSNRGKWFTSPLVFDFITGGDLETVIGIMKDPDEFLMYTCESTDVDEGDCERHPDILDADGEIISNVFRANAFTDTGNVDFCVMGYINTTSTLDLLCSSQQAGGQDDLEFEYDITELSNPYNITMDYGNYNVIAHAGEHKSITANGDALSEIITSFGIFEIDYELDNELLLVFEQPKENAVVLSVDAEGIGREDLIVLTRTNLWYIDDGFSSSGANITEYTVNPCVDSTWQVNTSVGITVTASDPDGDDVNIRAILYSNNDTVNEQPSEWVVVASGGSASFSFTANATVSSDIILLQANDTSNPTEIDEIELSFSVGVNGLVFGECTTEIDVVEAAALVGVISEDPTVNNSMDQAMENADNQTGLGTVIIWTFLMIGVAMALWITSGEKNPTATLGVIVIVEIGLFIIGAKQGYIPIAIVVTIGVISLVGIGLWIKRTFVKEG